MEEESKEGTSLGEIFSIIFSQKWLALIICAVITLAGTLGLYLGYNRMQAYYTGTFSYMFNNDEPLSPVYPDDSPFNYYQVVSRKNLDEVKNSDEAFSSVNTQKMYSNGDISISRSYSETGVNLKESTTSNIVDVSYTITVKARYFPNRETAANFIREIAALPARYISALTAKRDVYLSDFADTAFLEDKFSLMSLQSEYLLQELDDLATEMYGHDIGSQAKQLQNKLTIYVGNMENLKEEMRKNKYVHDVDAATAYYTTRVDSLTRERDEKKATWDLLVPAGSSGGINVYTDEMLELAVNISELDKQIELYETYKTPVLAPKEFTDKLDASYAELTQFTKGLEDALDGYYKYLSGRLLVFNGAQAEEHGGMSLVVCIVLSLVIGLVVAAIVAYIVGKRRKNTARAALSGGAGFSGNSDGSPSASGSNAGADSLNAGSGDTIAGAGDTSADAASDTNASPNGAEEGQNSSGESGAPRSRTSDGDQ